jgi:hypothetical protein
MKRNGLFVIFLTFLFLCHGSAFGYIEEVFPLQDAMIKSGFLYQNFNDGELDTGTETIYNSSGSNNVSFMQFDVETAPESVSSAKLRLYNRPEPSYNSYGYLDLHVVLSPWEEEGISYGNQPSFGYTYARVNIPLTREIYYYDPQRPYAYANVYVPRDEYIEIDITALYNNWKSNPKGNFGVRLNTSSSSYCSSPYTRYCYPGTFYSAEAVDAEKWPRLILEISNNLPTVDAGDNVDLKSHQVSGTVIYGSASDADADDVLSFRWMEGQTVLSDWQALADDGKAALDLGSLPAFTLNEHILTLEVKDGQATVSDTMILTVENSAPTVVAKGGGVYEIYAPVTLGGEISDYDGDVLTYQWLEGEQVLDSGTVPSNIHTYAAVNIAECILSNLDFGIHTLILSVDDGANAPVTDTITVEITDTTKPTLAPVAEPAILWPPTHRMKKVVITTHAKDNSGFPVELSASVSSNEPQDGLWRWDRSPDWNVSQIDHATGIITVELRAERALRGDGRTYTILVTATDIMGNSSEAAVDVVVPRCRGKRYEQLRREMRQRIQERREQRMESRREKMQEREERIAAQRERIKDHLERIRERWENRRNRRR